MAYSKTWNDSEQYRRFYTVYGNGISTSTSDSVLSAVYSNSRSGQRVESWQSKIKNGEFAASPYSTDRYRTLSKVPGEASAYRKANGSSYWVQQNFVGYQSAPGSFAHLVTTTGVENTALGRILEKIRFEQHHADTMVALAEMGSTIRQFGAPASAILELSNRHLNRIEAQLRGIHGVQRKIKFMEVVARSYLEYTFGLAPLIEDTRKIAEALARWKAEKEGDLPQPTHSDLTAVAKASSGSDAMGALQGGSPYNYLRWKTHTKYNTEVACKYTVRLKHSLQADFGSNDRLLQLLGFDPMRWVPTLYEALPWTWLLDYFTNIGKIVEAGFTDTSHVAWIQKAVRSQTNQFVNYRLDLENMRSLFGADATFNVSGTALGSYEVQRTTFARTLPSSLGVPVFELSYPNKIGQLANAVAALMARRPTNNSPLWVM